MRCRARFGKSGETPRRRLRADPLRGQVFLLRCHPIGNVELGQRLALAHRVERRANVEPLEEAVAYSVSRLHRARHVHG